MKNILYKASERGKADFGWLKANYSFSFSNYYNPERIHFGVLRVLNDDTIGAGAGFGTHPHDNMEIITIPLKGAIAHRDSLGSAGLIKVHDVQVMSAGSGIQHSEYNASKTEEAQLFQIWIFPKEKNVAPRYDQKTFLPENRKNQLMTVVSPQYEGQGLYIHQDAWISLGNFDQDLSLTYQVKRPENGVYFMVIEGEVEINGTTLGRRDAWGISGVSDFTLTAKTAAEILVLDVPMHL